MKNKAYFILIVFTYVVSRADMLSEQESLRLDIATLHEHLNYVERSCVIDKGYDYVSVQPIWRSSRVVDLERKLLIIFAPSSLPAPEKRGLHDEIKLIWVKTYLFEMEFIGRRQEAYFFLKQNRIINPDLLPTWRERAKRNESTGQP